MLPRILWIVQPQFLGRALDEVYEWPRSAGEARGSNQREFGALGVQHLPDPLRMLREAWGHDLIASGR